MNITRRQFLQSSAAGCLAAATASTLFGAEAPGDLIIDTHQHLWDLSWQKLPWLAAAGTPILKQSYTTKEYNEATAGLNIRTIYMEVDVAPEQHVAEAEHIVTLCRDHAHPTIAAVVGGRPANEAFPAYIKTLKKSPEIKGIRQVLHGGTPRGLCLEKAYLKGIQLLGDQGLSFDLCMRPGELGDGAQLARECPGTRFVVDHCGNADPKAFNEKLRGETKAEHAVDNWKRGMEALAKESNTICKISGIVARAPSGWKAEQLAPIVNFCLDTFGPDRVVFGSDWPVCLLGAPLKDWVNALKDIVAERSADQQAKLWRENAMRFYGLSLPQS